MYYYYSYQARVIITAAVLMMQAPIVIEEVRRARQNFIVLGIWHFMDDLYSCSLYQWYMVNVLLEHFIQKENSERDNTVIYCLCTYTAIMSR